MRDVRSTLFRSGSPSIVKDNQRDTSADKAPMGWLRVPRLNATTITNRPDMQTM
jgi:hypothetical protein